MAVPKNFTWIIFVFLELIWSFSSVSAEYCTYQTAYGYHVTYCPEICCEGLKNTVHDVCCGFSYGSGAYVGAGLGVLLIFAATILCCTYMCCKQRILRRARESQERHGNPRCQPEYHDNCDFIPTVSGSVEFPQPPPYEPLPPPYYPTDPEKGSDAKDKNGQYPDEPPPEYSMCTVTNEHTS